MNKLREIDAKNFLNFASLYDKLSLIVGHFPIKLFDHPIQKIKELNHKFFEGRK
jgi:hypothetical protein